jgi:hypothetical protein
VSGASLQTHTLVILGLPVLNHDHAVNGIDFGDHGEMYIMSGGVSMLSFILHWSVCLLAKVRHTFSLFYF